MVETIVGQWSKDNWDPDAFTVGEVAGFDSTGMLMSSYGFLVTWQAIVSFYKPSLLKWPMSCIVEMVV